MSYTDRCFYQLLVRRLEAQCLLLTLHRSRLLQKTRTMSNILLQLENQGLLQMISINVAYRVYACTIQYT